VAMDANQSHRVVSEVTGLRESNIRYTLGSLLDRRLIARHYYIDLFRIGFRYYDLYFTMPTSLWARKDDVVAHILAQPQTAFFCEHTGVYQFDVAVSDRSHRGVQDLIESLGARFPDIFAQREVVIARSLTDFLPWPLEQRDPHPTLRIEASPTSVEVDAVDLRILGFLSTEPVARSRAGPPSADAPGNYRLAACPTPQHRRDQGRTVPPELSCPRPLRILPSCAGPGPDTTDPRADLYGVRPKSPRELHPGGDWLL